MLNTIVLDFETTGVNVLTDYPVQAALAIYDPSGKKLEDFVSVINPGIEISLGAERVHGISAEKARSGKTLPWFADFRHTIVWKYQPAQLIGYNIISFDLVILQRLLARYKNGRFKFPPIESVVDVMFLCCRYFQSRKWPKLIEAVNRLGIPHSEDDFHNALSDVKYTWLVYQKLMNLTRK